MSQALAPAAPKPARRRLAVPAHRTEARETLAIAAPFFLRAGADPAPAAPPLLSFEGDAFMEDLAAAVANPAQWPKLLPWRDWAEPPQGMLDANGAARYDTLAIARHTPLAIERDPALPVDGDGDGDGAADGVPAGAPPWLRKLYLPLHQRFTFVAFDVACQRAGWPRLARSRVLGGGAVVRRLRPGATEAWEDWISGDGKRGIWITLARPLGGPNPVVLPRIAPPVDPEALTAADFKDIENVVRARLGLAASAALPTALDSARLTLLPPDFAAGEAARHCTLHGYVPVFSAAEQATDIRASDVASLTTELRAKAKAALQATATAAPALRDRIAPKLTTLLTLTVLPPRPSADAVDDAWEALEGFDSGDIFVTGGRGDIEQALDAVLRQLLAEGWAMLAPDSPLDSDALLAGGATPETTAEWLNRAQAVLRAAASGSGGVIGHDWTRRSFVILPGWWRVLLDNRLNDLADRIRLGTPLPRVAPALSVGIFDDDAQLLLACCVLRLRRLRMALVVSLRQQMFGDQQAETLTVQRNQIPQVSAGALGQEIMASLGLESWRGTAQEPAWPILSTQAPRIGGDQRAADAHAAAVVLEDAFADFEAAGAEAGSVFEEEQDARLAAANAALLARLSLSDPANEPFRAMRRQGLELREQPARGLFALPGPRPDGAALATAANAVALRFSAAKAVVTARDTARVQRLRYDHDSLYAIWCWVRVAGRDACEPPQIIWTQRSEPFSIAEPTDVLGARPATIQLPDIGRLIRDIPRIAKAKARPFAGFAAPPNSGYITGEEAADTQRAWGIAWVCSFGIPVLTICAYILFSIIFSILIILPGFFWMLLLKFCIPIPVPKKSP
jgi:hypothetical protein